MISPGPDGLRAAVLRFLSDVLKSGTGEMKLYSDQDMDWMTGSREFLLRWISLMNACVSRGVRVTIIHNIDRGADEMLSAIRQWLPLYMSGRIEGRYCLKANGGRFSHTIFLAPGAACITGCAVAGGEKQAVYRYETMPEELSGYESFFQSLLGQSRRLIDVGSPEALPTPAVERTTES